MSGKKSKQTRLRLVTAETVAQELVMRDYYRSGKDRALVSCQGSTWVWDLPSGSAMMAGFLLRCEQPIGHKGYCRDATEIQFVADRHRLDAGSLLGKVVHWAGYGDTEILDLEKHLSEEWG